MRASTSAWTEQTWNSVTGCPHGDAERMALRLHAMNAPGYARGFALTLHEARGPAAALRAARALAVRDQCLAVGVAFLFKPWGAWDADGVRCDPQANGRWLAGRRWDERPEIAGALL